MFQAGSLYFPVVGRESSGIYESGWGVDSAGNPRLPHRAAALCGSTIKATASTCRWNRILRNDLA